MTLRVLALEPFYGGSHQNFLDEWIARSRHRFHLLTLPASKWKWRMRQSSFVWRRELEQLEGNVDVVFASDMVNLAELSGLLPAGLRNKPSVLYMHENQLTYPVTEEQERDFHFALSNFSSALTADEVWFNSAFHRSEFLAALPTLLRRLPKPRVPGVVAEIASKSVVEHPGVAVPSRSISRERSSKLQIGWVSRWEHDKDPATFLRALDRLSKRGFDFGLTMLGESYTQRPPEIDAARQELSRHVESWGFLPDRDDYFRALSSLDVVVSTALHEFFGLAICEAVLAGACPLLPDRLSYPELLQLEPGTSSPVLYRGGAGVLARRLRELDADRAMLEAGQQAAAKSFGRFDWRTRAPSLDGALDRVVRNRVVGNSVVEKSRSL